MATQNTASIPRAQPVAPPPFRGPALPGGPGGPVTSQSSVSPPSKRELVSWWKKFRKNNEKADEKTEALQGIFGVPLAESIRYANVAISLQDDHGESFIYGYVPIVVAKCGVFLKEKAVDVEGIFRLSGSAKRIKDLQTIFNSPDRYGKGLDWTGYTVHDAANILRRYLNQLPEPIVPLEFYDRFRDPLRSHQLQAVGDKEAQANDVGSFDLEEAVSTYQKLITELPPLNRQLLLYILDLLAVFSSKSDLNRMNASNLAAIFQPGIISHPNHDMNPSEYRLSQDVLIFLIEKQDNFLIGLPGTAADEKTVKDVESGPPPMPSPKPALGRSTSNASAGADSLRMYGVRRNVSVSSRGSRDRSSNGVPSPRTPGSAGAFASGSPGGGLGRSNTMPSKKSPAVPSGRFQRQAEHSGPTSPALNESDVDPMAATDGATSSEQPLADPDQTTENQALAGASVGAVDQPPAPLDATGLRPETPATLPPALVQAPLAVQTAPRERKISSLFSRSPLSAPADAASKDQRLPKRLQKRARLPGGGNESAQSSQNSLHGELTPGGHTPLGSPDISTATRSDPMAALQSTLATSAAASPSEMPIGVQHRVPFAPQDPNVHGNALQVPRSPENSVHSRSSVTDASDFDALDNGTVKAEKAEKRRRRWPFPSAKKNSDTPLAPPPPIGQRGGTRSSTSSAGSANRQHRSIANDSQLTQALGTDASSLGYPSVQPQSSQDSTEASKDNAVEQEKKGFLGKLKAKMSQAKEEKKERVAEKERAKSPPRTNPDHAASRSSLAAIAQERLLPRGRSIDKQREEVNPVATEAPIALKATAETAPPTSAVEGESTQAVPAETKPSDET